MVCLQLGHLQGYGEAPTIPYYNVTVEAMIATIEQKKRLIEKFAFTEPERYWHYLHHLLPEHPFLVAALDMAGWDLFGKMRRQPIQNLLGLNANDNSPITSYTIGLDSPQKMLEKMLEFPWPLYKIKLGCADDVAIVTLLRAHSDADFIVDVNAGWKVDEAMEKIKALAELGVRLIEQPLAKDDWEGMKVLKQFADVPLFADESCVFKKDIALCSEVFDGINIKLTKCSGISPAVEMIKMAREAGLKVMMGSMNETTIGSAAIAQFLPFLDYVDVDGPLLLNDQTAQGLTYNNGVVSTTGLPGFGVQLL